MLYQRIVIGLAIATAAGVGLGLWTGPTIGLCIALAIVATIVWVGTVEIPFD